MANILFVEDSKTIRILASSALQKHGHEVVAIDTPYEIKKALTTFKPDVIVLDLHLPKLSSDEVVSLVRQVNPAVQIVIYSSGEERALAEAKERFSARSAVKKEASFAPLLAAIDSALTVPPPDKQVTPSPAAKTTRLLLIDDDTDQHVLLTSLFRADQEVEVYCTTSTLVVGMIRRLNINVVLADVHLPGVVQGTDVVDFLIKFGMGEYRKFFLYSAKAPDELDALAKQCGADGYIIKGQPPQALKADIVAKVKSVKPA